MQISAEIRWFWRGECPGEVRAWFNDPHWTILPTDLIERTDRYFPQPGNREIGCKLRDVAGTSPAQSELKGLVGCYDKNEIEIWAKWDWIVDYPSVSVDVTKRRRLRLVSSSNFHEIAVDADSSNTSAADKHRCQIELTEVRLGRGSSVWWTLGLEASGDLESAPRLLECVLDRHRPPANGWRCSYPEFLDAIGNKPETFSGVE